MILKMTGPKHMIVVIAIAKIVKMNPFHTQENAQNLFQCVIKGADKVATKRSENIVKMFHVPPAEL